MGKEVKNVKAVLFDSSVLINLHKQEMQDELRDIISYYLPVEDFMETYAVAFNKFQYGLNDEQSFFSELFSGFKLPPATINKIINQHNSRRNELVKLNENVNGVIDELSKEGYVLGVISNMPKQWFLKDAERLGLNLKAFKSLTFGSDAGALKPDVRIFSRACNMIRQKPSDCVFVTNHDAEVEGAREAGMLVVTVGSEAGDFGVDSTEELIDLFTNTGVEMKQRHETPIP